MNLYPNSIKGDLYIGQIDWCGQCQEHSAKLMNSIDIDIIIPCKTIKSTACMDSLFIAVSLTSYERSCPHVDSMLTFLYIKL